MYDHYLDDMADKLEKDSNESISKEKAYNILKDFWKNSIAVVWNVEDVKSSIKEAKELHSDLACIEVTPEDELSILKAVFNKFDASIGINWDSIRYEVYYFFQEKKEKLEDEKNLLDIIIKEMVEFGYASVNSENIKKDKIYSVFLKKLLKIKLNENSLSFK